MTIKSRLSTTKKQTPFHEDNFIQIERDEDVFNHLMYTMDASVDLSDNVLFRLGALLHDIGKPNTYSIDKDNRIHFYRHEVVGATVAYEFMRRLKFSKKDIEYVVALVRHHQWRFEENSRDKTIKKWLQTVGKEVWKDLISLRAADRKGNLAKQGKNIVTLHMRTLMEKAQIIIDTGIPLFKDDLAVDGHDLKKLGITPGPIYKTIFNNMLGIVGTDTSRNTKKWLSDYAKRNYTSS